MRCPCSEVVVVFLCFEVTLHSQGVVSVGELDGVGLRDGEHVKQTGPRSGRHPIRQLS